MVTQKSNIPALRFPEFKGEWKAIILDNLGQIITGSTPDTSKDFFYGGDKMFVSPVDIGEARYINNTKTKLTDIGFFEGRFVPKGSSLFVCIGSTIGKVAQTNRDCVTNQQINAIVPNEDNVFDFVYSLDLLQK